MRPIDADALKKEIDEWLDTVGEATIAKNRAYYGELMGCIKDTPTVERPRGEWISVEDRLPDPFVTVLVHMPLEKPLPTVHAGYISKDGEWVGGLFNRDKDEVTHWMPLPEAPDDMRGEGE